MDPNSTVSPDYVNGSSVEDEDLYPNLTTGFNYQVPSPDFSFMDVPFVSSHSETVNFTPYVSTGSERRRKGDTDSSDPIFKYITQILMEEDIENMFGEDQDPLALRDTEQSLYQVLGEQYSPPVDQPQLFPNQNVESPETIPSGSSNEKGSDSHSTSSPGTSSGLDILSASDAEDHNFSPLQVSLPSEPHFQSTLTTFQNVFSDEESILQLKRGFEEASKFIPKIDLGSSNFSANENRGISNAIVEERRNERQHSPDGSRSRKNHDRERDLIERITKQSAVFVEESDLSELFDKILLHKSTPAEDEESKTLEMKGGKTQSKGNEKKKETIDLRNLLIFCAQAVASFDRRTATELLKQIREHASAVGDGTQRLAYYFANGLEARLEGVGAGSQIFIRSLTNRKKATAAAVLKAYRIMLTAMPYKKLSIAFTNLMICKKVEKATALHIVDFGILFGFQWPSLIQHLSLRNGGPPKLRITGIELPQRGLRPTERINETGRRLARYCERFNVPFEYNSIPLQDWETLRLEDLKIDRNEMLAVNNLNRFENLLDETAELECPRDAVLRIIRSMNPDILVHSITHGTFNGPFFDSRFKEALLHFSSIFDALDANLSREDPERLMFENEFYGRAATNVVACEGSDRTVRPETYKRWQNRNIRAGFKPVLMDQEVMEKLRENLKTHYHKDYVIEEDGPWLLQGWKGRIVYASSCWVPS